MRILEPQPSVARNVAGAVVSLALAIVFAGLFYFNYWRWRECIEQSLSSCVTPEGNFTTAGMVWGYPCLPLLALSYGLWMRARDLRRERAERAPSPSPGNP